MKKALLTSTSLLALAGLANASLWIDFNSNQDAGGDADGPAAGPNPAPEASTAAHNNAGYQSYHANHESTADLGATGGRTGTYSANFAITGVTSVTLTPDWTNSTNVAVRQSIDRTSQAGSPATGFDASWTDTDLNLVTDFLGTDTRTANGGNGNWDGTTGTPTYMTLTLGGLAAGDYEWTSFHHDTEHVHGDFAVWIDTGAGFTQLADGSMTEGSVGGNPDPATHVSDFAGMAAGGSIYDAGFTADGTNDVTVRFAPYANTAVHRQIWGINGFQLEQIPEPSTGVLGLLGAALLLRRRRK